MATGQIALPPGFELEEGSSLPPGFELEQPPKQYPSSGMQLAPVPEAALSMASRIPAGVAGIAAGALGLAAPGERGQGARYMDMAQQALTYEPRDPTARKITEAVSWPFVKLSELANWAGEKVAGATGSAGAGSLTNATLDMLPALLGLGLRGPAARWGERQRADMATKEAQNVAADANLKEISDAGYRYPATATDPSFVKKRIESVGGKAATGQQAAIMDQAVTNQLARRAAGLPEDAPLTPSTLAEARTRIAAPYEEVSKLSPTAAAAWRESQALKSRAKDYWKEYNRSGRVAVKDRAKRLDSDREFFENLVESEAVALGRPDLLSQLRQARVDLAKNFDVERALNTTTGEVDARVIGRMYEKDKGKRMTGELSTIGKFANRFRSLARPGSDVPTPGVSALEPIAATGLGMMGHGTGLGFWPSGVVLAGGPARALALSKFMQRQPQYKTGMAVRLSDIGPDALSVTPALGLRMPDEEQP